MARVKERIAQVSLDLIFGVPGQTLAEWRDDLQRAVAFEPDHIATYGLTYEKGTPLWKERERGAVRPLDEEAELGQYACAIDTLESAGFEHYELSNFAPRWSLPPQRRLLGQLGLLRVRHGSGALRQRLPRAKHAQPAGLPDPPRKR